MTETEAKDRAVACRRAFREALRALPSSVELGTTYKAEKTAALAQTVADTAAAMLEAEKQLVLAAYVATQTTDA